MQALEMRVRELEMLVDTSPGSVSAAEAVEALSAELHMLASQNDALARLLRNLSGSPVRLSVVPMVALEQQQLEAERQAVLASAEPLAQMLTDVGNVHAALNPQTLCMDTSVLAHRATLIRQLSRLSNLELRYNGLLVRSIALLQNTLS